MTAAEVWEAQVEHKKKKPQRERKRTKLTNGKNQQNQQKEKFADGMYKLLAKMREATLAEITKNERVDVELPRLKREREKTVKNLRKLLEEIEGKMWSLVKNCEQY